ncbi:hypothetical protein JCM8208_006347 [Rhodotorula glutinis]
MLRRPHSPPNYCTPVEFLELEADYLSEEDRVEGGKGAATNKRHKSHRRDSGHGHSGDSDDEEDQLASGSEDDSDSVGYRKSLLARADELDRAVLQQGKAKKRSKKREPKEAKVGRGRKVKAPKKDPLKRLPKEVLLNILARLSYGTLHAVAHLSRFYRDTAMLEEADNIWEAAREAEGLPDLQQGEWEWWEVGYAGLVHGKNCVLCGKRSLRWPDAFLRMRLCKPCRSENIVRLDHIHEIDSDLHGAAKDCVIQSRQSPDDPHQLRKKIVHGYLPALESQSDILWALQEEDDAADEKYYAKKFAAASSHASGSRAGVGGKGGRPGKYDEAPRRKEGEWGEAVTAYVATRRKACKDVEKEGEALFVALDKLYAREATQDENEPDGTSTARREAFEERVLGLSDKEAWNKDDFYGPWLSDKLVNRGPDTLDDAEWETLKPKVLKVLAASRKKRLAVAEADAQAQRRDALLPAYQSFRHRQPSASAIVWTPLFADFLLFPSVRALWQPHDAVVDPDAIDSAQEGMDEDLNEWRTSLRLHVIQLVLSNTLDLPDDEELDSDADAYDQYDDEFLKLLTSGLLCAVDDCRHAAIGRKNQPGHVPARPTFFGSLSDVLLHQHEAHDYLLPSSHELARAGAHADSEPHFRIALPLEVSHAVVAMCDAAGLDDEVAEPDDLDEVLEGEGGWVQWINMPGGGRGRKEKDWRAVLCSIYRAAVKAQHARPPRSIGIPAIALAPGSDE